MQGHTSQHRVTDDHADLSLDNAPFESGKYCRKHLFMERKKVQFLLKVRRSPVASPTVSMLSGTVTVLLRLRR